MAPAAKETAAPKAAGSGNAAKDAQTAKQDESRAAIETWAEEAEGKSADASNSTYADAEAPETYPPSGPLVAQERGEPTGGATAEEFGKRS